MATGITGAPKNIYSLIGNNPLGERLWVSRDYIKISVARTVNSVGSLVFEVPGSSYSLLDFPIDGIVELWRSPLGGNLSLFLDTVWFIRRRTQIIRGGMIVWKITAYDGLFVLGDPSGQRGRVIAYNPYNDFTDKLEETDDMCKEIVRENLGSLASDVNRDLGDYLNVEADESAGPIILKEFSRRNVLATLQEIAQTSEENGTYLAFDIVCTSPPSISATPKFSLEFRTYTQQRGTDHRISSATPVLIGPDFGNMDDVELDEDWTNEANFIYATGQSVEHVQAVATAQDDARIGLSPYNRREYLINGQNNDTTTATGLQNEAEGALRDNEPRIIMTGTILDTEQARFDQDWTWGDYLTAQIAGRLFDCRVNSIAIDITRDVGESIRGAIRGENVF